MKGDFIINKMSDYDIFGNIAIMKAEGKTKKEKLAHARELLKKPGIKTVLQKTTNVKGRLRTIKTKYILGEKNLIANYKENACIFNFNVETCYFSPRLANERQIISQKINMNDRVLVMFAGVGAYPIVIYKYKKPQKIIAVEIGRECCNYFRKNLILNKIPEGRIEIIQGDVKRKVNKNLGKFDVVIMARPNLKESFLQIGLSVCKSSSILIYYGFCKDDEINKLVENLLSEAKEIKRKIKIKEITAAGEIAPYKHRYRIEIEVLS